MARMGSARSVARAFSEEFLDELTNIARLEDRTEEAEADENGIADGVAALEQLAVGDQSLKACPRPVGSA